MSILQFFGIRQNYEDRHRNRQGLEVKENRRTKRFNFIRKTFGTKISIEAIHLIMDYDPDQVSFRYSSWMIREFIAGNYELDSLSTIKEDIETFRTNTDHFESNDINDYTYSKKGPKRNLEDAMKEVHVELAFPDGPRFEHPEAELLVEMKGYSIHRILTAKAARAAAFSCHHDKTAIENGQRWCFDSSRKFRDYQAHSNLYILQTPSVRKYAICCEFDEVRDRNNAQTAMVNLALDHKMIPAMAAELIRKGDERSIFLGTYILTVARLLKVNQQIVNILVQRGFKTPNLLLAKMFGGHCTSIVLRNALFESLDIGESLEWINGTGHDNKVCLFNHFRLQLIPMLEHAPEEVTKSQFLFTLYITDDKRILKMLKKAEIYKTDSLLRIEHTAKLWTQDRLGKRRNFFIRTFNKFFRRFFCAKLKFLEDILYRASSDHEINRCYLCVNLENSAKMKRSSTIRYYRLAVSE